MCIRDRSGADHLGRHPGRERAWLGRDQSHRAPRPSATRAGPGHRERGLDAGTLALVAAIGAMALLEAALLIGPAFAVGARRQQRQLALLAAAGAERRTLRQ